LQPQMIARVDSRKGSIQPKMPDHEIREPSVPRLVPFILAVVGTTIGLSISRHANTPWVAFGFPALMSALGYSAGLIASKLWTRRPWPRSFLLDVILMVVAVAIVSAVFLTYLAFVLRYD